MPCLPPGDLPDPGIKPAYPALQVDSLPLIHQGSPPYPILHCKSEVSIIKKVISTEEFDEVKSRYLRKEGCNPQLMSPALAGSSLPLSTLGRLTMRLTTAVTSVVSDSV